MHGTEPLRLLQGCEHPKAEEVDFQQAEVGAVVLVPLDDRPPLHRGRLDGHHFIESPGCQDHSPGVLSEVPREVLDFVDQAQQVLDTLGVGIEAP